MKEDLKERIGEDLLQNYHQPLFFASSWLVNVVYSSHCDNSNDVSFPSKKTQKSYQANHEKVYFYNLLYKVPQHSIFSPINICVLKL